MCKASPQPPAPFEHLAQEGAAEQELDANPTERASGLGKMQTAFKIGWERQTLRFVMLKRGVMDSQGLEAEPVERGWVAGDHLLLCLAAIGMGCPGLDQPGSPPDDPPASQLFVYLPALEQLSSQPRSFH